MTSACAASSLQTTAWHYMPGLALVPHCAALRQEQTTVASQGCPLARLRSLACSRLCSCVELLGGLVSHGASISATLRAAPSTFSDTSSARGRACFATCRQKPLWRQSAGTEAACWTNCQQMGGWGALCEAAALAWQGQACPAPRPGLNSGLSRGTLSPSNTRRVCGRCRKDT